MLFLELNFHFLESSLCPSLQNVFIVFFLILIAFSQNYVIIQKQTNKKAHKENFDNPRLSILANLTLEILVIHFPSFLESLIFQVLKNKVFCNESFANCNEVKNIHLKNENFTHFHFTLLKCVVI